MADKEDLKAVLEQVGKRQLSIEQVNNRIDKLEQNNHPTPAGGLNASASINNVPDQGRLTVPPQSVPVTGTLQPISRPTLTELETAFFARPYLMVSKCTIVRWASNRRQKEH
ncbi:hypothetical protein RRG08_010357 [Elysia crispata]|uniref:Uncharacterized protein n=1 Tax=Elysia crispata TaxID=231223 RepID=A0AAE0Z363_9GAST|nr:hypothetical protein RRG08_010357 [Elysia crispata]